MSFGELLGGRKLRLRGGNPSVFEYVVGFFYIFPFLLLLGVRSGGQPGSLLNRLLLWYGALAAPIGLWFAINAIGGDERNEGRADFFLNTGLVAMLIYVAITYVQLVGPGQGLSARLAALYAGVRSGSDLTRLVVSEEPTVRAARDASAGRVMLGSAFDALLSADAQRSVLLLGPARSGKTSTVLAPTIAAWDGPVIVTTTKDDDRAIDDALRPLLAAGRPLFEFTPTRPLVEDAFFWSPLTRAQTWAGARIVAREMTGAVTTEAERSGHNAYFLDRAEQAVAALLHIAAVTGASMSDVVSWALDPPVSYGSPEDAPPRPWDRDPESESHEAVSPFARMALEGLLQGGDSGGGLASIWSTVARTLGGYLDEDVLAWSGAPPGWAWSVERFLREDGVLVITASSREQRNAVASVTGLIADVVETRYSMGRDGARPLLLALDELANIAPLRDLPSILSEGGSQGVTTMAVLQDLSQARNRFAISDGLLSLANNVVVWPGIRDRQTLEVLERIAGTEYHRLTTTSTMRGTTSGRESSTTNQTTRGEVIQTFNVLSAAEISRGHPRHAALFSSEVPPFFMRMHLLDAAAAEHVAETEEQPVRAIEVIVGERKATDGLALG